MRYYHNLTPWAEEMAMDYEDIVCYSNELNIPLIEYTDLKTRLSLLQFVQMIIPDEDKNLHIYLALKNMEDVVIIESLWNLEQARKEAERVTK
jgi:hypothetical protein